MPMFSSHTKVKYTSHINQSQDSLFIYKLVEVLVVPWVQAQRHLKFRTVLAQTSLGPNKVGIIHNASDPCN